VNDSQPAPPLGNPFPDHGATPSAPVQLRLEDAGNHPLPVHRARDAWDDLIDAGIARTAQLVYLRLALRANRDGLARCSSRTLALELGLDQDNVKRELRTLTRRGFIGPVALVAGTLVAGGPTRDRIGYQLAAMRAPIRSV
jgi:hypothetical protein